MNLDTVSDACVQNPHTTTVTRVEVMDDVKKLLAKHLVLHRANTSRDAPTHLKRGCIIPVTSIRYPMWKATNFSDVERVQGVRATTGNFHTKCFTAVCYTANGLQAHLLLKLSESDIIFPSRPFAKQPVDINKIMRALQFSNQDIIDCKKSRGIFGTVQPSNETTQC